MDNTMETGGATISFYLKTSDGLLTGEAALNESIFDKVRECIGVGEAVRLRVCCGGNELEPGISFEEADFEDGTRLEVHCAQTLVIPVDRVWDTQWNPPGVPTLRCSSLRAPYGNATGIEEAAHYTFEIDEHGKATEFSRILPDGSRIVVFSEFSYNCLGEEVLHFDGNGSFGTLIKGTSIPSGPGNIITAGTKKPSHEEATQWLLSNFGV